MTRKRRELEAEKRKSSSVSESDFFGLVDKVADKKKSSSENEGNAQAQKITAAEPVKEKVKVVYVNRSRSGKEDNSQKQPEKKQVQQTSSDDSSGGFGIYQSKETISNTKSNNTVNSSKDEFYPAYLEEDTKIKANSPVVFVLSSDIYLSGVHYKKNSTLLEK